MTTATVPEYAIHLHKCVTPDGRLHEPQDRLVNSVAKRLVVKAGRRGGKTWGIAKRAVKRFLKGRRQLYTAPTSEQTDSFWFEVKRALREPIDAGVFKCNESERFIEKPGTKQRIKAKTCWNADMLRGDAAADLYFDEFQLTNEDAWDEVGAPMLLDNNGDAVFIFTPPSLKGVGISKARDPRHASKLFKKAQADTTGFWQTIHFTSLENPFISQEALQIIVQDMSLDSYRREILAQDDEIETSWLVHSKFNESLCKIKRFTIPLNWDVYSGHDFGSANPAAVFLAQVKLPLPLGAPVYMRYNDLVLFREYAPGAGLSAIQHADRFRELTKGYKVARSVGGNVITEDEIRQAYTMQGWSIQPPTLVKVPAQVDRVVSLEESNRLYIFDDCWMVLAQIANCLWKLDSENKPTNEIGDEKKYHLLAGLRYILSYFMPETVRQDNRIAVASW